MNLTAVTHSAELVTDAAVTVDWSCDFTDIDKTTGTVVLLDSSQGTVNAATTTTIVAAPGANVRRRITRMTIRNRHAVTPVGIVVQKAVSGTPYIIDGVPLAAARSWNYMNDDSFGIVSSSIGPGGADATVQYNGAGAFAGLANVKHDVGDLLLLDSTPSVPPAGSVKVFARSLAQRRMLAMIGPTGLSTIVQPFQGRNKVVTWNPIGNATTVPLSDGLVAPTVVSATARTVAVTNMVTMAKRLGSVSTAVAGIGCGMRSTAVQFALGPSAGLGGFTYVCRFAMSDAATVADARFFVGLTSTTTLLGNANPSTLLNSFGVSCDSGETTMRFMNNDGVGPATTVNLGANFPTQTLSADLYELAMFCPPNGNVVNYQVTRLNTGDVATGTISTDLPTGTTLLAPQLWRNNGTSAQIVGIDLVNLYIETDQ